jgi:hypothetical protein
MTLALKLTFSPGEWGYVLAVLATQLSRIGMTT